MSGFKDLDVFVFKSSFKDRHNHSMSLNLRLSLLSEVERKQIHLGNFTWADRSVCILLSQMNVNSHLTLP